MTAARRARAVVDRARAARRPPVPFWVPESIVPSSTSTPGPHVLLINDCRDQINFGAQVLVEGLLGLITGTFPGATITPIPSHWLMDVTGMADAFVDTGGPLRQPKVAFPSLVDHFETIADDWQSDAGGRDTHEYLDRMAAADLVILNGEGSIYRNNQSAMRELFLAWFAKTRLGKPTVFANGMVHLSDITPILPPMVRKTFGVLDGVAVREPCSLRNVREWLPQQPVDLFPDSAFFCFEEPVMTTPAVASVLERVGDRPYYCFDPGSMPMDARIPGRSALFELTTRLQEIVPDAVFVSSAPHDDYISTVAGETGSIFVDGLRDHREYMALVAGAQFVVTGRYHNPMLAAMVGTPTIAFGSSSHKVHGACETIGLIGAPFDGTDVRSHLDAIVAVARNYVDQRDDLREQLLERSAQLSAEVRGLGRFLADVLVTAA